MKLTAQFRSLENDGKSIWLFDFDSVKLNGFSGAGETPKNVGTDRSGSNSGNGIAAAAPIMHVDQNLIREAQQQHLDSAKQTA